MKDWTDKNLFDAICSGDNNALSVLFLRHYDYLMHYGLQIGQRRTLVEGCIQELFVHLYEAFEKYAEIRMVRAYLFKSLRNRILAAMRQERRIKSMNERALVHFHVQFCKEDLMIEEEVKMKTNNVLLFALNRLPTRQKEAIYLRYYGGLSTREIAKIMGVANQTILNTLYQALQKLRANEDIRSLKSSDF